MKSREPTTPRLLIIQEGREVLINMSLIHRSLTWAFYLVAGATVAAGIIASLVGLGWAMRRIGRIVRLSRLRRRLRIAQRRS